MFNEDKVKIKMKTIMTIISRDTVINGDIETETSIRIDGKVRGNITTKGIVLISRNASVTGDIKAESIVVAGCVEGNLHIEEKTNIEDTGELYGDVETKRLLIDENSVFFGNCIMKRENAEKLAEINARRAAVAKKRAGEKIRNNTVHPEKGNRRDVPEEKKVKHADTMPENHAEKKSEETSEGRDESEEGMAFLDVNVSNRKKKFGNKNGRGTK
ncbi:MAG: polymer-forming cytoskeletal protein [Lachnospiraceae bacterium]|nr:polymer-forming cytoskeletal protein [Lachnospiraceae bacterium]